MQIPILIEPMAGNGYRAKSGEPLAFAAEGATRDEAVQNLRQLVQKHLHDGAEVATLEVTGSTTGNPWVEFAGMFKDDPYFEEWQEAIAENRRNADRDADVP